MKKWIRWKGLIPFAIICAALAVFFLFYANTAVRKLIESTGTSMVGAKVETGQVSVHLSPLGIDISDLQVTNPSAPMSNAVEINHIAFGLNGGKLLLGKVIIDNMQVDGLRFNTPRQTSGALPKKAAKPKPAAGKPSPKPESGKPAATGSKDKSGLGLPDINTVMSRETLQTQQVADELQKSIQSTQQHWAQLQKSLPGDQRIQDYQNRLAKIQHTDTHNTAQLLAAIADLKKLQQDVKGDLNTIDQSRKQVKQDLSGVDSNYHALLKAPGEDKQRLAAKYAPNAQGVGNMSALLFGPEAGHWAKEGLAWYKKLAPMLGSGKAEPPKPKRFKGVDVAFREYQPSPNFLIRLIRASVQTPKGNFNGEVHDVTDQPQVLGKATTFNFSGRNMSGMQSLDLDGKFDHVNPQQGLDTLNMDIHDYKVSGHTLTEADGMRLRMASALSDTRLRAQRSNGKLSGNMNIHLRDIKYDNHAAGGDFQALLVESFNKIADFNIDTRLSGTLGQPGIAVSSDLDKRLNARISQAFARRTAEFRKQLDARIKQATEPTLQKAKAQVAELRNGIESQLNAAQQRLDQQKAAFDQQVKQYQAQYQAQVDAEKNKLKNSLQDKAKDLLNQLRR